mmetsp:Transcript_46638/g.130049  ORF Transcript_46638/g.130049 Transcript_46638/m.130049 type:complete len:524 (-) Transcript_46638:55-1626(-)
MTKKIVPAPPPLTEEDLQRLREEPWTDEEYHELIKLFQIFPPRIKKTSFEINEGEVVGDRWDAIVYQHNTPPPTEEEKAEYEAREEEKVKWQHRVKRKVGLEHEDVPEVFPHQKRNRSKEQVWDLIDEGVFYNLLKEEAVELTEQQKLEMRTDLLFKRCSPLKAKLLSQEERRLNSLDDPALLYGEIEPNEFAKVLQRIQHIYGHMHPGKGIARGKFYDIGSGSGKACLVAAMLHPFELCCGIETLSELCTLAEGLQARHDKRIASGKPPIGYNGDETDDRKKQVIRFACTDALEDNSWSEATMTFCHSTAFSEEMMLTFAETTELMEIGSVVITCTKPLPTTKSRWLTLLHDRLEVAWGTVKVWAYEKLTTEVGAGVLLEMALADAAVREEATSAPAGLGAADAGLGAAEEGPTILNAGQNMLLSPPRPSRKPSVTVEQALGLASPLSFSPPPDVGLVTTPLEDIPISPAFMPQLPKGLQNLPEAAKRRLLQRMVKEQMEFQERAKIAAAMGQEDLAGDDWG